MNIDDELKYYVNVMKKAKIIKIFDCILVKKCKIVKYPQKKT